MSVVMLYFKWTKIKTYQVSCKEFVLASRSSVMLETSSTNFFPRSLASVTWVPCYCGGASVGRDDWTKIHSPNLFPTLRGYLWIFIRSKPRFHFHLLSLFNWRMNEWPLREMDFTLESKRSGSERTKCVTTNWAKYKGHPFFQKWPKSWQNMDS